jgi:carbonic anhydrase
MKSYIYLMTFVLGLGLSNLAIAYNDETPESGLERLIAGNKRYMADKTICPARHQERRIASHSKQKPFAIVLGCSDSRVSPELVFDQGVGDVFVVRDAGNIVGDSELDSINYSAIYNNSSVIIVLGHENCGAVTAVLEDQTADIQHIAKHIERALEGKPLTLDKAVEENIRYGVEMIKKSPPIAERIKTGKVMVVGAYYHLKTGEVTLLD